MIYLLFETRDGHRGSAPRRARVKVTRIHQHLHTAEGRGAGIQKRTILTNFQRKNTAFDE